MGPTDIISIVVSVLLAVIPGLLFVWGKLANLAARITAMAEAFERLEARLERLAIRESERHCDQHAEKLSQLERRTELLETKIEALTRHAPE